MLGGHATGDDVNMARPVVAGLSHATPRQPWGAPARNGHKRLRESSSAGMALAYPYGPWDSPDFMGNGWLSPGQLWGGVRGYSLDRLQQPDPAPAGMMTETEWLVHLAWARDLVDHNPQAAGILGNLVNFVGDMEVRFSLKGESPGPIPLGDTPVDSDVGDVTDAWEEWGEANRWGERQPECRVRGFREGEAWLRHFLQPGKVPATRFGEPEHVRTPRGGKEDEEWGWGVRTDPDDAETVLEYWFADPADKGVTGERVPADRVDHFKLNVDGVVKRGVSDFLSTRSLLNQALKLLSNVTETSVALARYLWIEEQAAGTTEDAVRNLIDAAATHQALGVAPPSWDGSGSSPFHVHGVEQLFGPTISRKSNGTKVGAVPATHSAALIATFQAAVRTVLSRRNMPESMSGDASNANFASSLVAGGPFVRTIESLQLVFAAFVKRLVNTVLRLCVESGRLKESAVGRVKIDVVPPAVVIVDQLAQAQRFQILCENIGLDKPTALQELGYEPKLVVANTKAWTAANPPPDPMGLGGGGPGGPDDGSPSLPDSQLGDSSEFAKLYGESVALSEAIGPPPHPGLVFDRGKHRWVRPGTDEAHPVPKVSLSRKALVTAAGEQLKKAAAADAAGDTEAGRNHRAAVYGYNLAAKQLEDGDRVSAAASMRVAGEYATGLRKMSAEPGEGDPGGKSDGAGAPDANAPKTPEPTVADPVRVEKGDRLKLPDLADVAEKSAGGSRVLAGAEVEAFVEGSGLDRVGDEAKQAVLAFQGSSALNKYNRDPGRFGERADLEKLNQVIDQGITTPLPEAVSVFRGVDDAVGVSGLKEGDEYTDGAHLSTSLDRDYMQGFHGRDKADNVVMQVRVPKGTKTLYAGVHPDYVHERELILPRNGRYRVASVRPMGLGKYVVVDYLGRSEAAP